MERAQSCCNQTERESSPINKVTSFQMKLLSNGIEAIFSARGCKLGLKACVDTALCRW